jgi:hypothetical protein
MCASHVVDNVIPSPSSFIERGSYLSQYFVLFLQHSRLFQFYFKTCSWCLDDDDHMPFHKHKPSISCARAVLAVEGLHEGIEGVGLCGSGQPLLHVPVLQLGEIGELPEAGQGG